MSSSVRKNCGELALYGNKPTRPICDKCFHQELASARKPRRRTPTPISQPPRRWSRPGQFIPCSRSREFMNCAGDDARRGTNRSAFPTRVIRQISLDPTSAPLRRVGTSVGARGARLPRLQGYVVNTGIFAIFAILGFRHIKNPVFFPQHCKDCKDCKPLREPCNLGIQTYQKPRFFHKIAKIASL